MGATEQFIDILKNNPEKLQLLIRGGGGGGLSPKTASPPKKKQNPHIIYPPQRQNISLDFSVFLFFAETL